MRHENQKSVCLAAGSKKQLPTEDKSACCSIRRLNARFIASGQAIIYLKTPDIKGGVVLTRLTSEQALERYRTCNKVKRVTHKPEEVQDGEEGCTCL